MGGATPEPDRVAGALLQVQDDLCREVSAREGGDLFREDTWRRPEGGGGRSRVIEGGSIIDRGGVNHSRISGERLPEAASVRHPELAGLPFEAMGVSVVFHPVNPYAPTAHFNVRAFFTCGGDRAPGWWFGGGFDLTPCYGFDEDTVEWHRAAREVCEAAGSGLHRRFKRECDRYFHLPHRGEQRGIGGIFFDDFDELGFEETFAFCLRTARTFRHAYFRILDRRSALPFGESEKEFQRIRRGRYVEFNLLYDRGTRFGLLSGGRTESILMSMPAEASWRYDHEPAPGGPEAALVEKYLTPRDWLAEGCPPEPPDPPPS